MAKPIENFEKRLREALNLRGIKQIELANKTGISRFAISHYLKGDYYPSTDKIYLLAQALNVNEAWLLGYDVEMEKPENLQEDFLRKFKQLDKKQQARLIQYMELLNGNDKNNK